MAKKISLIAAVILMMAMLTSCFPPAISGIKVGDTITFAEYEGSGKWVVLDIDEENDKALLITKDVVASRIFDDNSNVWEDSDLRAWLNSDFIEETFDEKQKDMLIEYEGDMVFVLSSEQALTYFDSDEDRLAHSSEFALAQGINEDDGYPRYWLKSPGNTRSRAAYVCHCGEVYEPGTSVTIARIGVRPAVWVRVR